MGPAFAVSVTWPPTPSSSLPLTPRPPPLDPCPVHPLDPRDPSTRLASPLLCQEPSQHLPLLGVKDLSATREKLQETSSYWGWSTGPRELDSQAGNPAAPSCPSTTTCPCLSSHPGTGGGNGRTVVRPSSCRVPRAEASTR